MTTISDAVRILRAGGLVAFPTETVYGLGADGTNDRAVARIFAAKGRPGTNPLIVHVADGEVAKRYAREWPETAARLAARFWPGPLTLVLPKAASIVDGVTAGRGTVGLRVPNHPIALELLRAFGGPVAAPSANQSNRISPTTAQHVRDELGDAVDLILDGGPCLVGIESTVLDLSSEVPTILRPGSISQREIESVIGPVRSGWQMVGNGEAASSPGQLAVHYSPRTRTWRFETSQRASIAAMMTDEVYGVIAIGDFGRKGGRFVTLAGDPASYAREFYKVLRELDEMPLAAIFIELPPVGMEWAAVRDRIMRASVPWTGGGRTGGG
jgi:L-threonylcarbamoyladenylate synthase